MGEGDTQIQTHRQHGDRISLLLFFKNKDSRLDKDTLMNIRIWCPDPK
jgi:hypothetical protein